MFSCIKIQSQPVIHETTLSQMFLGDRDSITNNTPKLQLIVSASMSKGDFLHFGTWDYSS